jgi:hypothetical protein
MSETKIIRTVFDITPSNFKSGIPDDYDWKNDPTVVKKRELAQPGIEAFIRQYGTPEKPNEEKK